LGISKIIQECVNFDEEIINFGNFSPNKRLNQEKILAILFEIQSKIYPLTRKVLQEHNIPTDKGSEDSVCYLLLQNLK